MPIDFEKLIKQSEEEDGKKSGPLFEGGNYEQAKQEAEANGQNVEVSFTNPHSLRPHVTDSELYPSHDAEQEALYNIRNNKKKIVGLNGEEMSLDDLDDATWYTKLLGEDTEGKIIRKTTDIRSLFTGDASQGEKGGVSGEDAQNRRNITENALGWVPFFGRALQGESAQNGFMPYKDPVDGQWTLKEVDGNEQSLQDAHGRVMSAYGPKHVTDGYLKNLFHGLSNVQKISTGYANIAEMGTDLGEATTNFLQGNGFKSEEGETDRIAAQKRAMDRLEDNAASAEADKAFSGEYLAHGLGSGIGSMAEFALTGSGLSKGANIGMSFAKGLGVAAKNTLKNASIAEKIGLWGGGAILNMGEAYTTAKQSGLNEEDSALMAVAVGGLNTILENKFGANVVNKYLTSGKGAGAKEVSKTLVNALNNAGEGITKEALDKVTPGVLGSISKQINKFTKLPVIGQSFEEGFEEGAQSLISKTGELIYDNAFSKEGTKPGEGQYGTVMDRDTWKDVFGEAAIGALVGTLGGIAARNQNSDEYKHVAELVANGKTSLAKDAVDVLYNSGKIDDNQRAGYKNRIDQLDTTWNKNKASFEKLELEDNAAQLKAGALAALDDEFTSHLKIDGLQRQMAKINADPGISQAVKDTETKKLQSAIQKETKALTVKTAGVQQYLPNAEGKIPAVEKLKNPASNVKATKTTAEKAADLKAETDAVNATVEAKQNAVKELENIKADIAVSGQATPEQEARIKELEAAINPPAPVKTKKEKSPEAEPPVGDMKPNTKFGKNKNKSTVENAPAPVQTTSGDVHKDLAKAIWNKIHADYKVYPVNEEEGISGRPATAEDYDAIKKGQLDLEGKFGETTLKDELRNHFKETARQGLDQVTEHNNLTEILDTLDNSAEGSPEHLQALHQLNNIHKAFPGLGISDLAYAPTPETKTPLPTKDAGLFGPNSYNGISFSFKGAPDEAQLKNNYNAWQESLKLSKTQPQLIVEYSTKDGRDQFDIFAGINGELKKIGYLPATAGKADIRKDSSSETKAAHAALVTLKEAVKKAKGKVELGYELFTRIDAGQTLEGAQVAYTGKTLIELDDRFALSKKGDYVIYRRSKPGTPAKEQITAVLGKHTKADEQAIKKQKDLTNAYILKVKDPGGNIRFIGLNNKPAELEDINELTDIMNDSKIADKDKAAELNHKIFIAANPEYPINTKFDVYKGDVFIIVNENGADNKSLGKIKLESTKGKYGPYESMDAFMSSMTYYSKSKKKQEVKNIISGFKLQIPEEASESQILSTLIPSTSESLWGGVRVEVKGIKNQDPAPAAKKAVESGLHVTTEGQEKAKNPRAGIISKKDAQQKPEEINSKGPAFSRVNNPRLVTTDWKQAEEAIASILPAHFSLKNLRELANGIYNDGSTMGAFFDNAIYLADKSEKGTVYHEAFHAVFRQLIPVKEAKRLLSLAAKELKTTDLLKLEEYLADKFKDYMNNKKTPGVFKKAFEYLQRFVNWVSGNKGSIKDFFASVDRGAFSNAPIRKDAIGAHQELFSTLPHTGVRESARIVNVITAMVNARQKDLILNKEKSPYYEKYKDMTEAGIIDDIIKERQELESFDDSELDAVGTEEDIRELGLTEDNGRYYKAAYYHPEIIVKVVSKKLENFKRVDDTEQAIEDNEANETGERNFELSPFEQGGYGSVSRDVRAFIELTLYKDKDGNDQVVDFFTTYSALERTLAGVRTWKELLDKATKLAKNSAQVQAVLDRLNTESPNFKTKFQQAFAKVKVDYKQVLYDQAKGKVKILNANKQDVGDIQFARFKSQFDRLSAEEQQKQAGIVAELNQELVNKDKEDTDFAKEYADALGKLGMDVTPAFIEDVIVGENDDFAIKKTRKKAGLTNSIGEIVNNILTGGNPFAETKTEEGENVGGNVNRIKVIGNADSKFRDDLINTNFQNAEGKSMYTYVLPSHVMDVAQDIQDGKLDFTSEFFKLNPLVELAKKNPNLYKSLEVSVFNGVREENNEEGTTFKNIDPKTLVIAQHALYKSGYINPFVFETKSTSVIVKNPGFTKLYDNGLTDAGREYMKQFIKQDMNMFDQTLQELETLPQEEWIEGYHFTEYDDNNKPVKPTELLTKNRASLPRGFQIVQFPFLNKFSNAELTDDVIDNELDKFIANQLVEYKKMLADNDLDITVANQRKHIATKNDIKEAGSIENYLGEFLMTDFVFSNSYAQLHRGSEAKYKNGVDITKRAAGQLAAGYPLALPDETFKVALLSDINLYIDPKTMERVAEGKEMNSTDAQGYVSPRRFKNILKGLGRLNTANEKLIDQLIAGEAIEWNPKIEEIFTANSIKNVYFDGNVYIKTSVLPLFKEFTSEKVEGKWVAKPGMKYYHDLRERMEGERNGEPAEDLEQIDELYHESAFKLVKKKKNFFNPDMTLPERLHTQELSNRFWRLQVENPSGKTEITDGTQLIELIDSETNDAQEITVGGKPTNLGEARKEYQDLMTAIRRADMKDAVEFLDKLTKDGGSAFIDKIKTTLEDSGGDSNTIKFFEQLEKHSTEFKYSTDLPNINKKFQQIFLAHFTKNVFNQKVPGGKCSLFTAAGYMIMDNGKERPLKIHRLENGKLHYAECVMSEELLYKHGLKKEDFENGTIPAEVKEEMLTMLGFRIPTQSHHSMLPFKVVAWIPAYYGSTIIAPTEIVYLSGADYDVDALYIHRKDFKVTKEDGKKAVSITKDGNAGSYNRILDIRLGLLSDPAVKESLFTPATVDRLKGLAKVIGKSETSDTPYNFNTSRFNNWLNNTVGKANVGSAAMSNKVSAVLTKVGAKLIQRIPGAPPVDLHIEFDGQIFSDYKTIEEEDIVIAKEKGELRITTKNALNRKADSLSTIVSAMVDNAKERLASALNLTQQNLGIFSHMVSLGMGLNRTMLFANQPILRELTKKMNAAVSTIDSTGAVSKVLESYRKQVAKAISPEQMPDTYEVTSEQMLKHKDADLNAALYKKPADRTEEEIKMLQEQYKVLALFDKMSGLSATFMNVGKLLSTDKGIGATFEDFDKILEANENVHHTGNIQVDFSGDAHIEQNLKSVKYINNKLLPKYFLARTPAFMEMTESVKNLGVKNTDMNKLYNDVVVFFWMQRLNQLMKESKNTVLSSFQALLEDKNNNIVAKYKAIYKKLPKNDFLRQLMARDPEAGENPFYRLEFNGRIKTDPLFIEKLVDSFKYLAVHPDQDVKDFARDLIRYLTVKDNLKFLNGSFIRLIGPENGQLSFFSNVLKDVKGVFSKDMGKGDMFTSDFGKSIDEFYDSSWWDKLNLFKSIWFSQANNRYSLREFPVPKAIQNSKNKKAPYVLRTNPEPGVVVYNFSEAPEEVLEEYNIFRNEFGNYHFPEFFKERIRGDQGQADTLWVWKRDKKYTKDANGKVIGATYRLLPVIKNKYQSLYHAATLEEAQHRPVGVTSSAPEMNEEALESIPEDPYSGIDPVLNGIPEEKPVSEEGIPSDIKPNTKFGKKPKLETESEAAPAAYDVVDNLLKKLSERFNIKTSFVSSEEMKELVGRDAVGAFIPGKGVVINQDKLNLNTPLHEFAHPLLEMIKKSNPGLYARLKKGVSQEDINKLGQNYDKSVVVDEAIVRSITQEAAGKLKDKSLITAIKDFWTRVLGHIKNALGIQADLTKFTSLGDIANFLAKSTQKLDLSGAEEAGLEVESKPEEESETSEKYSKIQKYLKTRIARLRKSASRLDHKTEEYKKRMTAAAKLEEQVEQAFIDDNHEELEKIGKQTLDKAMEYVDELEKGNATDAAKNIVYAKETAEAWAPFKELSKEAATLYERLEPFFDKFEEEQVNNFATEKGGVTRAQINAQKKDIGTFERSVGALADSSNYTARTIGSMIKAAYNRIFNRNKKVETEIKAAVGKLKEYAKKNDLKLEDVYNKLIEEKKGTLRLVKKRPQEPELREFYDFYQGKLREFSKDLPIKTGIYFIPNIKKTTFKSVLQSLNPVKTRATGKNIEEDNIEDTVPMQFTKDLPADVKSRNLGDSLLQFGKMANKYDEMTEILPQVKLLQEQIWRRKYTKSSNPSVSVTHDESNLYKFVKDVIDMQVKGMMKKEEGKRKIDDITDEEGNVIGEKYVDMTDIADNLLKWNSLLRIGLSPMTAVSNWLFGDISNIIESVGGKYFTPKELVKASNMFMTQSMDKPAEQDKNDPNMYEEGGKYYRRSTMNQLLITLNPLQELDDYAQLDEGELKGKMSPEKLQEYMYAPQKYGEKWLQSRTMLAVMMHDGYLTPAGEVTEKYTQLTDKEREQLADKVQRINQLIHGRYSQREAAAMQQSVIYRLTMQFRKWIPAAIENRIGSKQYDNRLQSEIEGRYRTLGRVVFKEAWKGNPAKALENMIIPVLGYKKALESGSKLTENEIYNMRKNLIEITLTTATLLIAAGLKGDDDEAKRLRKNPWVKVGLTLTNRVSGDLLYFMNPESGIELTKSSVPLAKTLDSLIKSITYIPYAFYVGNWEYKRGSRKGQNKFYTTLGNITPGVKPVLDVVRLTNKQALEELN